MQGLTDEVVRDPSSIDLDAFAKIHKNRIASPGRPEMEMMCVDHAELAKSPYAANDDDIPFNKRPLAEQKRILAMKALKEQNAQKHTTSNSSMGRNVSKRSQESGRKVMSKKRPIQS